MTSLPLTRVPDPADAPVLRWGILAPGGIASTFVRALAAHTTQRVVACGSRSTARAQEFAHEHGIERAHGSYEQLLADPGVDVVYVASPHSRHAEQALAAIAAGKHVLVEKSFTQDARQAQAVVDAARAAGVTLMEAMWTRFLPHIDVLRQLLADGALGELVSVHADHGQFFPPDPRHRMFDPDAAGGALLDLGIYPVSFAHELFGVPTRIAAVGQLSATGVDRQTSIILGFEGGEQAVLHTALDTAGPNTAVVLGTTGRIVFDSVWYTPTTVTVLDNSGAVIERIEPEETARGMQYQAAELERLVAAGETGGTVMAPAESVSIMQTLDEVRRQIGLAYPADSEA